MGIFFRTVVIDNTSGGSVGGRHRGKPGDGKGTKGNQGRARRGTRGVVVNARGGKVTGAAAGHGREA